MIFEVYIDSLFFVNFVMNLFLLSLVKQATGCTATRLRLILAALLGSLLYCLFFFPLLRLGVAGMITGILVSGAAMLAAAFQVKGIAGIRRLYGSLIFNTLMLGGGILFVSRCGASVFSRYPIVCVLVTGGVGYGILTLTLKHEKKGERQCFLIFTGEKEREEIAAIVDTGNSLTEPISGKPVSVVSKQVMLKLCGGMLPELYRVIPYQSIGKQRGIMKGYLIPKVLIRYQDIEKVYENVYFAVCEEEYQGQQVILHPKLL